MKIKEIMAVDPETLDPEDSIEEAAQVLSDADVGCAPVVSNEMVLGVLTDRDIVVRAVAEGQNMKSTKVQDILTPGAIHCYEDDEISTAAGLMADHQIRRIVVVTRDNRLAGVLSLADIASYTDQAAMVLEEVSKPSSLKSGSPEYPDVEASSEAETSMRGAGVSETGERSNGSAPIDSLVRGELSAVETYKQALAKVGREPIAEALRRIELEHEEAVDLLLQNLRRKGGEAPKSSGLWGAWSKAVEGTAKIFGGKAAIKALKEGEEHGLHDYEDALKDEVIDPEVKSLIRSKLLPQTRAHIPALDRVLQAVR
jgi:CBS domain-containing protein/rubrerythrin